MLTIKKHFLKIILLFVFFLPGYYSVFSQETKHEFATIELITEPENAQIYINQTLRGITPIKIDSLEAGIYEIKLELSGYSTFINNIDLENGERKKLNIILKKYRTTGSLQVISFPENSLIVLDNDTIGKTPYSSDNIDTGSYELILIKPDYFRYKETITITKQVTYHVNTKLNSKKRVQNIRRVVLGSLAIGFGVIGTITHFSKLEDAQSAENEAWDNYMQLNLTSPEYEKLYKKYTKKVNETNKIINRRNVYLSLAGISCIGFVISIPF